MKPAVLFLEQQAWRAGAQRVLEDVLDALREDFTPIVAFPVDGPFAAELRNRKIETLTYPLGTYRPGSKSITETFGFAARSLVCGLQLARTIARRNIRLVYINGPRCLPAGVMAARLTRTPSVFHLHRALTRKTDILVAALTAAQVTKTVAVSKAAAASLTRANRRLVHSTQVLYNSVRRPVFKNGASEVDSGRAARVRAGGGPVVGMVGRITPQKGQLVLLRAAALLCETLPRLRLIFVGAPEEGSAGDAAYLRELKSEAAKLGFDGNVQWAGFQAELDRYYARFDVLAVPSIEAEGLPLVALEAAAWGVPVVASHCGGIAEVVRDGVSGLLVPPGDEKALARGLARVLGDSALRVRLVDGTRTCLDGRFSPETFRDTIYRIVSGLVAQTPGVVREGEIEAPA